MKENKKAILEILKKKSSKKEGKKDDKFESLVLNLALHHSQLREGNRARCFL